LPHAVAIPERKGTGGHASVTPLELLARAGELSELASAWATKTSGKA